MISNGGGWTLNTPEVAVPFVQHIYGLDKKSNLVENAPFPKEKHDYGVSKHIPAYPFLAKHLQLDLGQVQDSEGNIDESFVSIEAQQQMMVFNGKYPENAVKPNTRMP